MTSTGPFVNHGIRILAAVALLAAMSLPIRLTKASDTAPSPNFPPRNFAMLEIGHSGQFAMSARLSVSKADSLQSDMDIGDELDAADIEDEQTVTSPLASVSFDILPSPCPEPYSELVSFAVASAARPLRC